MNEKVFLQCLSLKKLFDIKDRPLRLHESGTKKADDDTFFRCISTALMGKDEYRVQIRSACVMRFITLMFVVPPECNSVSTFLNEYAESTPIKGVAYRDLAIQVWLKTHTPFDNMDAREVFKRRKDLLRDPAIEFVRVNNQVGYLSCRFTFGYIVASLYNVFIHLYDQLDEGGDVHQQPVIKKTRHERETGPEDAALKEEEETAEKQLHIYIWKTYDSFKLLVPVVERHTRTQHWLKGKMSEHAKNKYQLRKSDQNKMRNVLVRTFERLRDTDVHVCDVKKSEIDESCIYQIYPAGGDFKLHVEPQQHLFVFCVRESKQDLGPYLETLVELKHNITYPYFMLKKDAKRVVVLVIDQYRGQAIELVKKELNVD